MQLYESKLPKGFDCVETAGGLLYRPQGLRVHLVGIAGQGMSALAEVLNARGATVTGSDVDEPFFTTPVLREINVPVLPFNEENVQGADLVVYSAAYDIKQHPELRAAGKTGIPLAIYPEALGSLSAQCSAVAVCGTHGKTTITAMLGTLIDACELPATVMVGSTCRNFGDRSTLNRGTTILAAETCEYRRHFLHFHPDLIVLSGVEWEHVDYFVDYRDTVEAFVQFCRRLPHAGKLIYDADDVGAVEVANAIELERPDVQLTTVGKAAVGTFRLEQVILSPGRTDFSLAGINAPFQLSTPGSHSAKNAALAVAAVCSLYEDGVENLETETLTQGLSRFAGTRRRSEVVGEVGGITFVEDYGHHPTEIRVTLAGLSRFFAGRRLIVDFMPHTFSRTAQLLEDFGSVFGAAAQVILHDIYASARESNESGISGRDVFQTVKRYHANTSYTPRVDDVEAIQLALASVRSGDVFITMGAGDNWKLGERLRERLSELERS